MGAGWLRLATLPPLTLGETMERVFAHKLSGRRHTAETGTFQCDVYETSPWLIDVTGKSDQDIATILDDSEPPEVVVLTPEEEAEEIAFLEG